MSSSKRHSSSPPAHTELESDLTRIQELLDSGEPGEALKIAVGRNSGGPLHVNARAVCLMRLNRAAEAVSVLRSVTLDGGVFLKASVPLACKINLAAALALAGNASGCLSVLNELQLDDEPRVQALRAALKRWEKGLSLWEWIQWQGGAGVERPVDLEPPFGTLS